MELTPEENEKLLPVFHCIFIWYFIQVDAHAYASLPALWQRSMHTRFSKSDLGGKKRSREMFLEDSASYGKFLCLLISFPAHTRQNQCTEKIFLFSFYIYDRLVAHRTRTIYIFNFFFLRWCYLWFFCLRPVNVSHCPIQWIGEHFRAKMRPPNFLDVPIPVNYLRFIWCFMCSINVQAFSSIFNPSTNIKWVNDK